MRLSELMKQYRKYHHISARSFAKQAGFSNAYISLLENDRISSPSLEALNAIAKAMGMSLDTMLRSIEDMEVNLSKEPGVMDVIKNAVPMPETKCVPMLGAVSCGEPIYKEELYGEYYLVDKGIQADFCLKAQGDSMINARIHDGDIVFIYQQHDVENGQIAAVLVNGEAKLKYFYRYQDMVVLRSANPSYKEMTYTKDELNSIRVLGRAVAFQSSL